jgi:microcystin-dependent protein
MPEAYFITFGTDRLTIEGESGSMIWEESAPVIQSIPGLIEPFAGSTVPTGYLLCDGAAVSRTTYATLFAVIGTTFGAGDGSTTFNLPDLGGRVPLGASSTHLLGSSGGSETVTLTEQELPAHVHEVPQHGHADTIAAATPAFSHTITQPVFKYNKPNTGGNAGSGGSNASYSSTNTATATRSKNLSVGDHAAAACTVGGSVTNADAFDTGTNGNDDAHNNMQPFLTMSYIICTGD